MSVDRSSLSGQRREEQIRALGARDFDMVVVGGGVTGAGVALDAVSRGLTVVLVEADDLASGTSSRSGKIFHGGLRYLEQLNFGLVREALLERDLMVERLCPHLVEPEPFLFPFTRRWQRPYVGTGVALYDLFRMSGPRSVRGHRHLSRRATLAEMPDLAPERVTGAVQYYDVRVDDARHTMTLARTAASLGATIITRARVVGVLREAGRVRGVRVHDLETGGHVDISARVVVNAAGVWADEVQSLGGQQSIAVKPAKGVHLVVPGDRINSRTGLITKTRDSVFIIRRWFDFWLLGTTDTAWEYDREHPLASKQDIDYLLGHANQWLRHRLEPDDVVGIYAGLRPLLASTGGAADSTAALRRDHAVLEGPLGMITVVGGKYTTYRLMARDAVDAATRPLRRTLPPSATDRLPLLGAVGFEAIRHQRDRLARESGLSGDWIDHLLGRYGTLITELLDLIADNPSYARPILGAPHYLAAEIVYAARSEGALHLVDVLVRRTRIFMETADRGTHAAPDTARLMGEILGWSDAQRSEEIAAYRRLVDAERKAAAMATDEKAAEAWQLAARGAS
ncbi:glycerol-3-phosphate dehydrogenase/oxidase [Actinopolymorpha alba]|uniref:glycerol-3-phosphate dehydrogenase/oxidase n=1 Tax=Actinopolymorpha alba TaxID=533267 RepID=UPI000375D3EA|nr:glycerol-3-phosphate dehydrogenase/oxidase [Actinopolymorpha alba]